MRREYSRIPGVESVDTNISGAVVKLKAGNKASLEHFWTIAETLTTEPEEARVVVAGRLIQSGEHYLLEVRGTGHTYSLKPNPRLAGDLQALVGERVLAEASITILFDKTTEVRLRKIARDSMVAAAPGTFRKVP